MFITFRITSRKSEFTFSVLVHAHTNPEDFHLDPVAFYTKWGKTIPQLPHHEIEIKEPPPEFFDGKGLHVHHSRKNPGYLFVCYPQRIASEADALRIFRTWCLGSVATLAEKVDLNTIFAECRNDAARMEQVLSERYNIAIVG
jgi:hypothetical protein